MTFLIGYLLWPLANIGESTTTECEVNNQLLAVIYWSSRMGNSHSCSRPQPAPDNGVRDSRANWLVGPPILMGSTPWEPGAWYKSVQPQREKNLQPQHVRQPPCLCGHSGYNLYKGFHDGWIPCIKGSLIVVSIKYARQSLCTILASFPLTNVLRSAWQI